MAGEDGSALHQQSVIINVSNPMELGNNRVSHCQSCV